ncbi:hypothetical protein WJX73_010101, partial [Symbiochloris irregularis]
DRLAPGVCLSSSGPSQEHLAAAWLLEPLRAGGFRVLKVQQQGPEDRLLKLLTAQQWQEALGFAQSHNLSADHVYRARWVAEGVTRAGITDCLAQIGNREWVVEQCMSALGPDAQTQAALLEYGLQETDVQLQSLRSGELTDATAEASGGVWGERDMEWVGRRLRLLQQRERLETVQKLCGGQFIPRAFSELRDCLAKTAAQECARALALTQLGVLLKRHARVLMPGILDILQCLPETLKPSEFEHLLPQEDAEAPPLASQADWIESQSTCQQLQAHDMYGLLLATEHLAALYLGWRPPSAVQVAKWWMERGLVVDRMTGHLGQAALYLQAGIQGGDFEACLQNCDTPLETILLEVQSAACAGTSSQRAWQVSLADYATASPNARVRMLLSPEQEPEVEADRGVLGALLSVLSPEERAARAAGILSDLAHDRLEWCASVVVAESFRLQVFESLEALSHAAVACVYAIPSGTSWTLAAEMLTTVRHALEEGYSGAEAQGPGAVRPKGNKAIGELDQAGMHVRGAELLSMLDQATSARALANADSAASMRLLRTCLARLSRAQPPTSDARWADVWRMLKELQAGVWSGISAVNMLAELCRALLRCGNWRLAQQHLLRTASHPLPPELAEQIVIAAAREYFLAANSSDATEIGQARQCLAVLSDNMAARQEADAIDGYRQLSTWGIDMLPLQFHQVVDRMEVVQRALGAHPDAYQDSGSVVKLARLLGVADRLHEVNLLLAKAAVKAVAHCGLNEMTELMERLRSPQPTVDTTMIRQLAARAIQGFPGDFAQQRQSYAASRRLALLGLSTFTLQATAGPGSGDADQLSVEVQQAQGRLFSSPWQQWQQCSSGHGSSEAAESAHQLAEKFHAQLMAASRTREQQLLAASDVRRLRVIMPHVQEGELEAALGPNASPQDSLALLLEVATHAAAAPTSTHAASHWADLSHLAARFKFLLGWMA